MPGKRSSKPHPMWLGVDKGHWQNQPWQGDRERSSLPRARPARRPVTRRSGQWRPTCTLNRNLCITGGQHARQLPPQTGPQPAVIVITNAAPQRGVNSSLSRGISPAPTATGRRLCAATSIPTIHDSSVVQSNQCIVLIAARPDNYQPGGVHSRKTTL